METFEDSSGKFDGGASGYGGMSVIAGASGSGGDSGGPHRGFCFVDFASHAAALTAIYALTSPGFHGIPLDHAGSGLKVDWAEPLNVVPEAVMASVKVLYISNLPPAHFGEGSEDGLDALFSRFGRVERVRRQKNYAFVHLASRAEAELAINELTRGGTVAGPVLAGVATKLQWSKPPPKPTGGTTAAGVQPLSAMMLAVGGGGAPPHQQQQQQQQSASAATGDWLQGVGRGSAPRAVAPSGLPFGASSGAGANGGGNGGASAIGRGRFHSDTPSYEGIFGGGGFGSPAHFSQPSSAGSSGGGGSQLPPFGPAGAGASAGFLPQPGMVEMTRIGPVSRASDGYLKSGTTGAYLTAAQQFLVLRDAGALPLELPGGGGGVGGGGGGGGGGGLPSFAGSPYGVPSAFSPSYDSGDSGSGGGNYLAAGIAEAAAASRRSFDSAGRRSLDGGVQAQQAAAAAAAAAAVASAADELDGYAPANLSPRSQRAWSDAMLLETQRRPFRSMSSATLPLRNAGGPAMPLVLPLPSALSAGTGAGSGTGSSEDPANDAGAGTDVLPSPRAGRSSSLLLPPLAAAAVAAAAAGFPGWASSERSHGAPPAAPLQQQHQQQHQPLYLDLASGGNGASPRGHFLPAGLDSLLPTPRVRGFSDPPLRLHGRGPL